jgi:Tfp pilus assembly protein PilX
MKNARNPNHGSPVFTYPGARQRGAVLFISLIVLVAMTLAGIALMRSVDTGNLIAGNLAFRNTTTSAADAGIEAGRSWLMGKSPGDLEKDALNGYFANWQEQFDPKTFNFTVQGTTVGADPLGNTIYYVVHRMCKESNKSIDATDCTKVTSTSVGSTKGGGGYGMTPLSGSSLGYFRITAKVVGPKNTVSYVQAFTY